MADMTRRERLQATILDQPVDRPAVALWRHFPGDDQRPRDLAAATLMWQSQWDWDFVKVSPASSFCLRDWGARDRWVGGDEGNREYTARVVQAPDDWRKLGVLDPRSGALAGQIECLELIAQGLGGATPFIQTVFSPLAQAKNLAGADRLVTHVRRAPDHVHAALEIITRTTVAFVEAAAATGIAGIYYAVQLANYGFMSEAEYREFGEPYDRRILAAAAGCWFNMAHLHGPDAMFDLVAAYPIHALNWHDQESGHSLGEGMRRFAGAVCGGLEHWRDILRGEPAEIRDLVNAAVQQTGGRRLIVGTGCVSPVNAPYANLRAVREAVTGR